MAADPGRLSIFHNLPSGGGVRVLSDMLGPLSREFAVTVHFPEGSRELPDLPGITLRRWSFPAGGRLSGPARMAGPLALTARLRALDSLCRRMAQEMNGDSGAVLVHNSMFVAAPPLLRYLHVPSVYFCFEYPRHIYEPDLVRRTDGWFRHLMLAGLRSRERRMDRAAAGAAGRTVALSSWMAGRLADIYGLDPFVVRPGVDTGFFSPGEPGREAGYVLSVGALWPFKGHDTALEAVAALPADRRPRMVVVADREYPGYGGRLSTAAARLGVDLEVLTEISDLRLRDLYRRAGAVLCCQRNEPYGLVPLEAMACCAPVIAVEEGGFPDNVRDGVNGLLVRRDPKEISSRLAMVLEDRDLALRLGRGGRDFVTGERTRRAAADDLIAILNRAFD